MEIEIQCSRRSRVYAVQQYIQGTVTIKTSNLLKHEGIYLYIEGFLNVNKNRALAHDSVQNAGGKSSELLNKQVLLAKAGKCTAGTYQFEFKTLLESGAADYPFLETYHGVCIYIYYQIRVEVLRSMMQQNISKTQEIFLEVLSPEDGRKEEQRIIEIKENTSNYSSKDKIKFCLKGEAGIGGVCEVTRPILGHFSVVYSQLKIVAVYAILNRRELLTQQGSFHESQIVEIQICAGNVGHNVQIPFKIVFPQHAVAPSLTTPNLAVEYSLTLMVQFENKETAAETFPLFFMRK